MKKWIAGACAALVVLLAGGLAQAQTPMAPQRFLGKEFFVADTPVWDGDPTPYAWASGPVVVLMNPNPPGVDIDVRFTFLDPGMAPTGRTVAGGTTEIVSLSRITSQPDKTCASPPCSRRIDAGTADSPVFTLTLDTSLGADAPFAAALLNPAGGLHRSDMTMLLPTCRLGTSHRVGSYINEPTPFSECGEPANSSNSWILVIATEDDTRVDIVDDTPPPGTLVHTELDLDAGDYLLWNQGSTLTSDVTGFHVETSNPANVFSGSDCTAVGLPAIDCNSLLEAVPPDSVIDQTGVVYPVLPTGVRPFSAGTPCSGASCTPDIFRFVADEPMTLRTSPPTDCHGVALLAGEVATCAYSEPFVAWSETPMGVTPGPAFRGYQLLASQDAIWSQPALPPATPAIQSAATGDPSMLTVLPVSTFACEATFEVPDGFDGDKLYAHVIRPTGGNLTLNGTPVTGTCTAIPSTVDVHGISFCTQHVALDPTPGMTQRLVVDTGAMSATVTGFSEYDAFATSVPAHEEDNLSPYVLSCAQDDVECIDQVPPPQTPSVSFRCIPETAELTPDASAYTLTVVDEMDDEGAGCLNDPPGPRTITRTWRLNDACNEPTTCVETIFIKDETPPMLMGVPDDEIVECDAVPPPATVTATDNCDGSVTPVFSEVRTDGPCDAEYTLTRTWTATDACGNEAQDEQVITVIDTTPPVITLDPNVSHEACLKMANHKYFCYENFSDLWTIADNCGCVAGFVVDCVSSEPENDTGDGNTIDDCVYDASTDTLCVRAERKGNNRDADREHPGRTYTIDVVATDCCGNTSDPPVVAFTIHVPHDFRVNPVDSNGDPLPCGKPTSSQSCCGE